MLAVLLAAAASGLPATKINGAVMSFVDPKTRSKVVLVGSMHYNPHSIGLARTTVEQEAANGRLRAVCVESCPTRWNATLEAQPVGSFLRALCDNEMQSGQEAGEAAGAEIVLADQSIQDTGRRIVQVTAQTLVELATPWEPETTADGMNDAEDKMCAAPPRGHVRLRRTAAPRIPKRLTAMACARVCPLACARALHVCAVVP